MKYGLSLISFAVLLSILGCSTTGSNIPHKVIQGSAEMNSLIIRAGRIKAKYKKIDVIFDIENNSADDLDFSKSIWRANFDGLEGSILQSDASLAMGAKQKRRALIVFAFDAGIKNKKGILELAISNIKTLEGRSLPRISMKYEAFPQNDNSFPKWKPVE